MRIAGIDPGMKGALVILSETENVVTPMPILPNGKEVDGTAVGAWLLAHDADAVVIEKIGARAHRNTAGKVIRNAGNEFRFATGYGVLLGVVQALGLPCRKVQPVTWKAAMLGSRGTDKQAAIEYVQAEWPDVDLVPGKCRVPQDGIADAACLAAYGLQRITWPNLNRKEQA